VYVEHEPRGGDGLRPGNRGYVDDVARARPVLRRGGAAVDEQLADLGAGHPERLDDMGEAGRAVHTTVTSP